jgi:hypothetical protein
VTALIEAGGHVAIIDLLPQPHQDCQALIEESRKCHYFWYVAPSFVRTQQERTLRI